MDLRSRKIKKSDAVVTKRKAKGKTKMKAAMSSELRAESLIPASEKLSLRSSEIRACDLRKVSISDGEIDEILNGQSSEVPRGVYGLDQLERAANDHALASKNSETL